MAAKKRLVTKADFDGMVCGMMLKELDIVDRISFAHPKDVESGQFSITDNDITASLPYRETAHMVFDHYSDTSEILRNNLVRDHTMSSTAKVIYNYYGKQKFSNIPEDIFNAVDKGFSAKIETEEILYPSGWILLNFIIDEMTGLEGFEKYSLSHADLILKLTDECRIRTVWEVLDLPEVEERLTFYFENMDEYKAQILRCSSVFSNVVVTDKRTERVIYPGNRFMVYAMFPECNVSVSVSSVGDSGKTTFVVGKSIIDRTYRPHIGNILKKHGGSGHAAAGTCQTDNGSSDKVMEKLIGELKYGAIKNLFMGYYNYY